MPPARQRNLVRSLTIGVLLVLLILFIYHVISDRVTPYTSHGIVETFLVQIAPRVSGQVIEVNVHDNQTVEQGQSLFQIDPEPFRIAVESAEAALALAGQTIGASTAQVAAAQAKVAERRADVSNVRVQLERIMPLVNRGVLPKAQGDEARAELAKAEAALQNAEAELERAQQNLGPAGEANPQIRAAMAALEKAQLELLYTTVVASSDGLITNLRLAVGQYAKQGQPVLTFLDVRRIWLTAYLRENQLGYIKPGDTAEVALDVHPGQIFRGQVQSIGWGVTTGEETATGTLPEVQKNQGWLREPQRFPVRIELEAEPGGVDNTGIAGIRLGSQASVIVYTDEDSLLNSLGWLWIRLITSLSYLY
jgi:multidrug resistance efflux pump